MNTSFDPSRTVLLGTDLRMLLDSEHISYGEVHSALKIKGIYIGNTEKSVTVPLLASTLLTPDALSALLERSVSRESQPKTKVSEIELQDGIADWVSPLKEKPIPDVVEKMGNVELTLAPQLTVSNDNKVYFEYEIVRRDFSKDLLQRELRFGGKIVVERDGAALRLDFEATHSSKETEAINRRLISHICQALKSANVTKTDEAKQITFGEFSNEERARFFRRLTEGVPGKLGAGNVDDIELKRDAEKSLPDDPKISWMGDSVRRLRIDGKKMNEVFLVSDESFYRYYHFQKMDISFPLTDGAVKGVCEISFSFSTTSRLGQSDPAAEFVFTPTKFSYDGVVNADAKKRVGENVSRALRQLIESKYRLMKDERAKTEGTDVPKVSDGNSQP